MKSAPFRYHAPTSVAAAVNLLAELGDEAKVLAGGQSLLPLLAMRLTRFDDLVDIGRVPELRGIAEVDGFVRVGATATHTEVERSRLVAADVPLLARAAGYVGHTAIRNRGTLGGALAHADPAAEFPAVATALDADLELTGPAGTRRVSATDFFLGTWTSALEADEVLVAAHFPVWTGTCGFAVEEYARRHGDYAMAGVVCGVQVSGGRLTRCAISLISLGPTPLRARAAEALALGVPVDEVDLAAVAEAAVDGVSPTDDVHITGAQRTRMARRLVTRALARAMEEAAADD
jgi:carbon-monoxide dehydrogenase medium subunit